MASLRRASTLFSCAQAGAVAHGPGVEGRAVDEQVAQRGVGRRGVVQLDA
jgi:hypothetical protein